LRRLSVSVPMSRPSRISLPTPRIPISSHGSWDMKVQWLLSVPLTPRIAKQLKAGAILESLFAQHPNHPGLAHYIIHAYDVPPLAARAIGAAQRYSEIAPSTPHASH